MVQGVFRDIIGHEKQKALISAFLETERIPHAFLFSGQDGIGKKTFAISIARKILCQTNEDCGFCKSCMKVKRSTHPDLFVIDKAYMEWALDIQGKKGLKEGIDRTKEISSISIDFIRGNEEKKIKGINEEVIRPPHEGKKRIIIIDNVENMTNDAANAFLKTLEEPPDYNLFFLVTSRENEVPATIKSRCVRILFNPVPQELLKKYFINTWGIEEKRADLISWISQGSIGCGMFWLEDRNLEIRRLLGELVLGKKRSFVLITLVSEYISKGIRDCSIFISFLLSLFRDMYMIKEIGMNYDVINRDFVELIEDSVYDSEWIEQSIKKIQETARIIKYNINRWLMIENLLYNIMR
ncbi:MAG: AAA family ATPase [Syntrophorhabdaceae bacterium]|nr:AAA family ATPase [Syntrophorhabdaceae bacterium]